eukprot:g28316.t1
MSWEDCDKYGLVHRYQHEIKVDLKDDLYVAGKVMYVYKLGYPKGQDPITYKADGTMARLRCASFSRSSLTDHLCNHYTACTGEVAAQLTIPIARGHCTDGMEGALEAQKRAALLAVSPICALIPAAVLTLVAILQPWWSTLQNVTYYPTNVTQITVTISSEISLWGHHGCRLNETWADICALPPADCVYPPPPPPGYVPPWTPPPLEEDTTEWRQQVVTGPPNVRITTTVDDRPFRCVSGSCAGPGATTTPVPSNYQAPAYAGAGNVAFGDGQARLGDEVVSSNEDAFRIPPTPAPPPTTTPPPTFKPEVGYVNPIVLATNPPTTTWAPSGIFAGLWKQTGSGSQDSLPGTLETNQNPDVGSERLSGSRSFPGTGMAVEKCPPYEQQYWDPLSPPAGAFICSLYATCGKMNPILGFLFVAEGLLCVNIVALVSVGIGGGGMDVIAAYANVVMMPIALVCMIISLILASSAGLNPPEHEMISVGAICAILAVLLVSFALVVACMGLFSHFAITQLLSKAEAAARVAAEHAQASLEATEEWRLQQDRGDAENAKKKPTPLGWRSKKVHPETGPSGLEDAKPSKSETANDSGELPETPRQRESLKMTVLMALADVPAQPQANREVNVSGSRPHVSVAVRSTQEAAPSPATEQAMRSFVTSPEGAVYAQRLGHSSASAPPSGYREGDEWVPKMSRSNGMTYYVNAETGETRWTPPPQEAWSGQETPAQAPEWKKKRLKNGTVISDKLQINTAPGEKSRPQVQAAPVQQVPAPAPLQVPAQNHQAEAAQPADEKPKVKVARPTVEIPARVEIPSRSMNSTDPQSPRSPGRFSAWK